MALDTSSRRTGAGRMMAGLDTSPSSLIYAQDARESVD